MVIGVLATGIFAGLLGAVSSYLLWESVLLSLLAYSFSGIAGVAALIAAITLIGLKGEPRAMLHRTEPAH